MSCMSRGKRLTGTVRLAVLSKRIGPFSPLRTWHWNSAPRLITLPINGIAAVSTNSREGRTMKIFLTGATGFIGGHVLDALCRQGHTVTCLVRRGKRGASGWQETLSRLQARSGVRVVEGEWTQPVQWLAAVAGHEAVVNTVGIIRERRGASFEAVHTISPCVLFAEAARTGVSKIVQISALGADEHAQSRFHLSKRAADEFLTRLGVPYVIL